MIYFSGTVLFAASATIPQWEADSTDEAREYIKKYNLTGDDVKMVKRDGNILVIAKKAVDLV